MTEPQVETVYIHDSYSRRQVEELTGMVERLSRENTELRQRLTRAIEECQRRYADTLEREVWHILTDT